LVSNATNIDSGRDVSACRREKKRLARRTRRGTEVTEDLGTFQTIRRSGAQMDGRVGYDELRA
jgi:hypothetical protein